MTLETISSPTGSSPPPMLVGPVEDVLGDVVAR
jgi:hypothetical protein